MRFRKKKPEPTRRHPVYTPSTEVFSYHAHRSAGSGGPRSTKQGVPQIRRQRRQWLKLLPSIVSVAVIVGSVVYATSLSTKPRFQINNPAAVTLLRDANFYENEASRIFRRSLLNYSKLTINTADLAGKLEAQFPELGDVAVIIPLSGRRPVIEAKPSQPVLKLSGDGGIYIVDEEGRALIKTDEAVGVDKLMIPYVIDQSGLQLEKGKQVLPLTTINFIKTISLQLQAKGLQADVFTLPAIPHELHVRLMGVPYYIKFDTQGSAREQAGTFLAVQTRLQTEGVVPAEYIDVRVPEKAFYK